MDTRLKYIILALVCVIIISSIVLYIYKSRGEGDNDGDGGKQEKGTPIIYKLYVSPHPPYYGFPDRTNSPVLYTVDKDDDFSSMTIRNQSSNHTGFALYNITDKIIKSVSITMEKSTNNRVWVYAVDDTYKHTIIRDSWRSTTDNSFTITTPIHPKWSLIVQLAGVAITNGKRPIVNINRIINTYEGELYIQSAQSNKYIDSTGFMKGDPDDSCKMHRTNEDSNICCIKIDGTRYNTNVRFNTNAEDKAILVVSDKPTKALVVSDNRITIEDFNPSTKFEDARFLVNATAELDPPEPINAISFKLSF